MNDTVEAIYQRVLRACLNQRDVHQVKVEQGGWGVVHSQMAGKWVAPTACACAFGCLLIEEQPTPLHDTLGYALELDDAVAQHLTVENAEVCAFIAGFDDDEDEDDEPYLSYLLPWYEAGRRLAQELGLVPTTAVYDPEQAAA